MDQSLPQFYLSVLHRFGKVMADAVMRNLLEEIEAADLRSDKWIVANVSNPDVGGQVWLFRVPKDVILYKILSFLTPLSNRIAVMQTCRYLHDLALRAWPPWAQQGCGMVFAATNCHVHYYRRHALEAGRRWNPEASEVLTRFVHAQLLKRRYSCSLPSPDILAMLRELMSDPRIDVCARQNHLLQAVVCAHDHSILTEADQMAALELLLPRCNVDDNDGQVLKVALGRIMVTSVQQAYAPGPVVDLLLRHSRDPSYFSESLLKIAIVNSEAALAGLNALLRDNRFNPANHNNELLCLAVQFGNLGGAAALLQCGRGVDASARNNFAIRSLCAKSAHGAALMQLLLDRASSVSDLNGPMVDACCRGRYHFASQILRCHGVVIEAIDLHFMLLAFIRNGYFPCLDCLGGCNDTLLNDILNHPRLNCELRNFETLDAAASAGNSDMVARLLERITSSKVRCAAIANAASGDNVSLIKQLLSDRRVDPGALSQLALKSVRSVQAAQLLIDDLRCNPDLAVIQEHQRRGNRDIVRTLVTSERVPKRLRSQFL